MAAKLNGNEEEQILQTIEMFEVITRSNPDDYQSLDLLREAYLKLDRTEDALRTVRMLGEAYSRSGQYGAALEELDFVLERQPDDAEIVALRAEIAKKLTLDSPQEPATTAPPRATPQSRSDLISTERTNSASATGIDQLISLPENDGNDALADFLKRHKLFPQEVIREALERVRAANEKREVNDLALSLLEEALRQVGSNDEDDAYLTLIEHTKTGFIPLDYYEADRQVVRMLPQDFTLGRLYAPFDLISRTMMVATCNPLDAAGRQAVQQSLDYNIQWYFATPQAIAKTLRETYRLRDK